MSTLDGALHGPARPSYTIARVDRGVRREIARRIRPHGLSVPQYTALSILLRRSGLSNAQLARRTHVTPQSMNAVISSLEAHGLIERSPSVDHGRILRATLTDEGRRVLEACDAAVGAFEDELLAALSPDQREAFLDGLGACVRALEIGEHR
jgi:DNA-binding MarR family transcriptional regulator